MQKITFFENLIENKLKLLHTAYLAKVTSTNGETAKIQPLGKTKAYGENARSQSPLSNVPIIRSARYKFVVNDEQIAEIKPIASGDIVLCVCCERDISEAKKGNNSVPAIGHHSMSDSVIVGIL